MSLTREQIISAEHKLIEGITNSDVALLDTLLHDDLLFIIPDGSTITKEMDLASHRAGHMKVEKLEPTINDIRMIGDTAVAVVTYDTQGSMMGNPIKGRFRYVRVWKQSENGVKVIGGSCMLIGN